LAHGAVNVLPLKYNSIKIILHAERLISQQKFKYKICLSVFTSDKINKFQQYLAGEMKTHIKILMEYFEEKDHLETHRREDNIKMNLMIT
jgi:hypothetical protein